MVVMKSRNYRPGEYTHFYIHEPKKRKISAAPFRDRVVHHALCNVIEPVFERIFIERSASRYHVKTVEVPGHSGSRDTI